MGTCLTWNYSEVLKVIHSHTCVIGCVAGHDHGGSNSVDEESIQHLVLKGVVERPPGSDVSAEGVLRDRTLDIQGKGVRQPVSLPLTYPVEV